MTATIPNRPEVPAEFGSLERMGWTFAEQQLADEPAEVRAAVYRDWIEQRNRCDLSVGDRQAAVLSGGIAYLTALADLPENRLSRRD